MKCNCNTHDSTRATTSTVKLGTLHFLLPRISNSQRSKLSDHYVLTFLSKTTMRKPNPKLDGAPGGRDGVDPVAAGNHRHPGDRSEGLHDVVQDLQGPSDVGHHRPPLRRFPQSLRLGEDVPLRR